MVLDHIGGERLHYWVMGGPWTYADDGHDTDGMSGADREYYESLTSSRDGATHRRRRHMIQNGHIIGVTEPVPESETKMT